MKWRDSDWTGLELIKDNTGKAIEKCRKHYQLLQNFCANGK